MRALTRKELYVLQATYAELPRPIKPLFSLEADREITSRNWKRFIHNPPTKNQLIMLKKYGTSIIPASRITASQILHEITRLAHYEAGNLPLKESIKLSNLPKSIILHDVDSTILKASKLAKLANMTELDSEEPETPTWTLLTFSDGKESCLKYSSLEAQVQDLTTLYPYAAREKHTRTKKVN